MCISGYVLKKKEALRFYENTLLLEKKLGFP